MQKGAAPIPLWAGRGRARPSRRRAAGRREGLLREGRAGGTEWPRVLTLVFLGIPARGKTTGTNEG